MVTFRGGVSQGQAFHNLLQQLSVKLWSYNAKMLLRYISLLPVTELINPCFHLKTHLIVMM